MYPLRIGCTQLLTPDSSIIVSQLCLCDTSEDGGHDIRLDWMSTTDNGDIWQLEAICLATCIAISLFKTKELSNMLYKIYVTHVV